MNCNKQIQTTFSFSAFINIMGALLVVIVW